MEHTFNLDQPHRSNKASAETALQAGGDGVDLFLVWRGAPKYLADQIEPVARSFDFRVCEISAERRTVFRDHGGVLRARSLRRVRLLYGGPHENFCVGLLAVLEEVEGLCRWVHVSRLDGTPRTQDVNPGN